MSQSSYDQRVAYLSSFLKKKTALMLFFASFQVLSTKINFVCWQVCIWNCASFHCQKADVPILLVRSLPQNSEHANDWSYFSSKL
jgi:hypothetical protein